MNTGAASDQQAAISTYAMRLGDDALILSHRLGEWVTRAPQLEEDMAQIGRAHV